VYWQGGDETVETPLFAPGAYDRVVVWGAPGAVGAVIARHATQANLVSVRPHDLRHRFGYRMAERVPIHRLAQIMGHDSLDTTMIYIKGTPRDLQREVEKIAWT
jgi:integrase